MNEIRTERLRWREPRASDVVGDMAFVSDYEVVKWTASWPYPADRDFVASRCVPVGRSKGFVGPIFEGSEQIGGIGLVEGELGYIIAQKHWGRGFATEMGQAIIARAFGRTDWDQITASVIVGNPGSARVLEKLGFEQSGTSRCASVSRCRDIDALDYTLTRADWVQANPYDLQADRLIIRGLVADDWRDLQRIGGVPEVARNMRNISAPWPDKHVQSWTESSAWKGRPGFRPAVCLHDGTLIGALGIGGDPAVCAYFLGQEYWGHGYATDAMRVFLDDSFDRFGLSQILASHFEDNPASGRVLRKLGFKICGSDTGSSTARLEDAPETLYRLSRTEFEARR